MRGAAGGDPHRAEHARGPGAGRLRLCPWAANRRASTKQTAISARNAALPHTWCSTPCQLETALAPGGVPGGNPLLGSGWNTPPPTSPAPTMVTSRGIHLWPGPVRSGRRSPAAAATNSNPVTMKLVAWTQPQAAVVEQAGGIAGQVEPRTGERLDQDRDDEQRASDGAAHEQAARCGGVRTRPDMARVRCQPGYPGW